MQIVCDENLLQLQCFVEIHENVHGCVVCAIPF